jgi:hypothetical protein
MPKVTKYLLYGLLTFVSGVLVCALIRPHFVTAERSISAFGTTKATIVPYAFASLGTIFWMMKAASALPSSNIMARKLAAALYFMSAAMVAGLLTPFSINRLFLYTHEIVSLILFGAQLYASILIVTHIRTDIFNYALFGFQVAGSVLLVLSLKVVDVLNLQLIGELTILASFIILFMRSPIKSEVGEK